MENTELLTVVVLVLLLAGFVVLALLYYRVPYKDSKGEYLTIHRKPLVPNASEEKPPFRYNPPE
jgi:hypothetical protein